MTKQNGTHYALYHAWGNNLKRWGGVESSKINIPEEKNSCVVLFASDPNLLLVEGLPRKKHRLADYGVTLVEEKGFVWLDKPKTPVSYLHQKIVNTL